MTTGGGGALVAQAIVRSASGERLGSTPIRAENLQRFAPDPRAAREVQAQLEGAGFEVSPLFGIALALAAPRALFERFFGLTVEAHPDGGWRARAEGRPASRELALEALPPALQELLERVTFEEPAEPAEPGEATRLGPGAL